MAGSTWGLSLVASFPIYAANNEFATATGANVDVAPGKSAFDDPPTNSTNLVIATKAGDPDPRLFELGDTYDLSWMDPGGGGSILNAVVTRSDSAGAGGVIVFEGIDDLGQVAEVIWTPGFDLNAWYYANFTGGNPPQFFNTDQNAAYTHEFICFEKSTKIHTPRGPVQAGRLEVGETVCTWSGRARDIKWIGRKTVPGEGPGAPVRFAKGAIGNYAPLKLSPQHRVLISAPEVELHYGAPEVLVPAIALVDGHAVRQVKRREVQYVHILLNTHDILIAEGAPCESLMPGYRTRDIMSSADRAAIRAALGCDARRPCRPILTRREAELIAHERIVPVRDPAHL